MRTCPTCRVPLGPTSLIRNIPMEKLAKTYFERCKVPSTMSSSHVSHVSRGSNDASHVSVHNLGISNQSSRSGFFKKC